MRNLLPISPTLCTQHTRKTKRTCLMNLTVSLLSATAAGTDSGEFFASTTLALSTATSDPFCTARPTSLCANAAASLTPSPQKATTVSRDTSRVLGFGGACK